MKKFIFNNKINFIILLLSIVSALTILGFENIAISNTKWIHEIGSDTALQHISWIFFKNDLWRFPIGSNPNFGDEFGNSIIFSDSIPIFALFFKLISPLMPEKFQYHSIWYFLCFFLQLYFSHKIIYKFTKNNIYSLTSALFFLTAPIFFFRIGMHAALSGQWILLLTLHLVLNKNYEKSKIAWVFVLILSCLIHFYFTIAIALIFSFLKFFNFFIYKENIKKIAKDFLITFLPLLLTMYIAGYFEIRTVDALGLGYGSFKLNLLSIVDPGIAGKNIIWSWLLPDIKLPSPEDMEGFNYLGMGQLLMIFLSLFLFFKNKNLVSLKKNIEIKTFVWISFIITALALSNKISFGSFTLLEIPLNKYIYAVTSFMRASGRLFWVVYYFLIILSLLIIFKSFKKKQSFLIILSLLIIQLVDTSSGLKNYIKLNSFTKNLFILEDPIWSKITKKNKIIKTTLPMTYNPKFYLFADLYEKYSIEKTNLIMTGRANRKLIAESRYKLYKKFNDKELDSNTIYFIDNLGHLNNLKKIFINENVGFFKRDGIWIMLKNNKSAMKDLDVISFNKIKPKLLKINNIKKIYFEDKSNYYGFGWSHNLGKLGIWSDGPTATLLFSLNKSYENLDLIIGCNPYLNKKKNKLEIKIFINDIYVKDHVFDIKTPELNNKILIPLDEMLIKNKEIKIDFIIKDPISPYEILESPDSRKLGFLVKNIELRQN